MSTSVNRRAMLRSLGALTAAAFAAPLLSACGRAAGDPGVVRIGYLGNLTHAPVIVGLGAGRLQQSLGKTRVESRTFNAGPRVAEALLGRAIDIGVAGPLPILSMHARHRGGPVVILEGCASGGASLVSVSGVRDVRDLDGLSVATPQLGSTQDIALRKYLAAHGFTSKDRGGTVTINALASADIFAQMRRGQIAAAWLPEPWATRVVRELPGRRLVDERDLWPQRRFPTAIVVVRREFLEARRAEVELVTAAVRAEIERAIAEPSATKDALDVEIERLTTRAIPRPILDEAWAMTDFTSDANPAAFATLASDAHALGLIPEVDAATLFSS